MAKKKKARASPMPEAPPPVRVATARDAGSGLLYAKDEHGNLFRVTPDEFKSGAYLPVDDETAQKHKANSLAVEKIGAEALALQVARGASARLIDIPATAIAGPEYAKYLERADEKYGMAGDAAEGVGMIAPLLLGGGTGAVARAGTAAGAFEAAGQVAGRGVARVAGEGALAGAAQFGTEGAAWAASHELSRQTLKGEPRDWDKLWSATGGGLLFGGVLGSVGGRFLGARSAVQRTASDLSPKGSTEEALAVAKAKFGDDLVPELEGTLAHPKPGLAEDLGALGQPGKLDRDMLARARHDPEVAKKFLRDEQERAFDGHVKGVADGMGGLPEMMDMGHEILSGTKKAKVWDQWMKDVPVMDVKIPVVNKYQEIISEIESRIARVVEVEGGGVVHAGSPLSSKVAEAKKLADHLRQAAEGVAKLRTAPEVAFHADTVKRFLQNQMRKKGGVVNSWDDMVQLFERESNPAHMKGLANMLEDESRFGAAGVAQKEINAAYHDAMIKQESLGKYFEASNVPNPLNPYQKLTRVNVDAVDALVRNADDPKNFRKILDVKDAVDAQLNFHAAMRKHYEHSAPQLEKLAAAESKLQPLKSALDKAAADAKLIGQIRMMERGDPHTWARIAGAMAGGLVGGPIGGALGFAAGTRVAAALNPYQNIATAAQLRKLINAEDGWKAMLIDKLAGVKWSGKGARDVPVAALAEAAAQPSGRKLGGAARVLLYEGFREKGDSDAAAYEKAVQQIRFAAANPMQVKQGVAATLGDAAHMYPGAVEYLANKTVMASSILSAYAPASTEDPASPFPSWWKMEPSDAELAMFEDIWEGVVSPRSVLARAADLDDISPEVVDVMDMLHPEYMGEFRADLQMALAERKSPPGEDRLRTLSILFKMALTPSMEPSYIDMMQDTHEMRTALEAKNAQGAQYRDRRTFKASGVNSSSKTDKLEEGFGDEH